MFTRPDNSTPTGVRVNLPAAAMPASKAGQRLSVAQYDRNDGFSPRSAVILHVPGLDTQRAFQKTDPVQLADVAQAFTKSQPIVVIDESTGQRQLIWSELDANAPGAQNTDVLIHPAKNFTEGHTYVVALRKLRAASGHVIGAQAGSSCCATVAAWRAPSAPN